MEAPGFRDMLLRDSSGWTLLFLVLLFAAPYRYKQEQPAIESSPQEIYMHRLVLIGLGIFGTLIYTLGPVVFMLFLPSGGLRAFVLCTLTFLSPFWALVIVWSCRVPILDSNLSESFVIGQHVLGWTWSAALWSVATVVLGESPDGIWLFAIVIMGVMGFLFVIDPFYRAVLRKFGPHELRFTEPPRKVTLELFRFLRLAITATLTRLVQRIRDWVVARMVRASTAPRSQLKGTHTLADKSFSPV